LLGKKDRSKQKMQWNVDFWGCWSYRRLFLALSLSHLLLYLS